MSDEAKNQTEENVESQNEEKTETAENQTEETKSAETEESSEKKEPTLEDKIAELEKQNAELKDQYLRKCADFDNYRKRMMQEKADAIEYANSNILKDLLDSLDNFDRTVEAAATATDPKAIADGVTMVNKSLVSMLENKYNLVGYGAVGDAFDPDIHEAIGMQESEEVKEEQLAAVYLKGYKLSNRVIRHAKVMVVKPKA